MQLARLCIGCGRCVENCPKTAVTMTEDGPLIDRALCDVCGVCADLCPTKALRPSGDEYGLEYLVAALLRDRAFFEVSGGGVTVSGGEPLIAPQYLKKILVALKQAGIHTVVETSGFAPWHAIQDIVDCTDLFFFDIKHLDEAKHVNGTGASNKVILENLKRLADATTRIVVRVPLIPQYNMDKEHLLELAGFVQELGLGTIHFLPYHRLGRDKYQHLGRDYELTELLPPREEEIHGLEKILASETQLNVSVRGA